MRSHLFIIVAIAAVLFPSLAFAGGGGFQFRSQQNCQPQFQFQQQHHQQFQLQVAPPQVQTFQFQVVPQQPQFKLQVVPQQQHSFKLQARTHTPRATFRSGVGNSRQTFQRTERVTVEQSQSSGRRGLLGRLRDR